MEIPPFWTVFEALQRKFQPFKRDLKHSNANFNHLNGIRRTRNANSNHSSRIWSTWMPILTIEWDLKHSNANSNHSNGILSFRMPIPERHSKHSNANSIGKNANSNHSNGIRTIWMQIPTIRTGLKPFECQFQPFEWDSKHSNANSNH